jgi:hypothetical protein
VNRWNIPPDLELDVSQRDKHCVYCQHDFSLPATTRGMRPSWEHIVNDERIISAANIALCCISCNASKGARLLEVWLQSKYCARKGISVDTVADVVREALTNPPRYPTSSS